MCATDGAITDQDVDEPERAVAAAAERGVAVVGVCNGFQVLC